MSAKHHAAVGNILAELSHEIERLGLALCSDPIVANRYHDELQAIDRISQTQAAIAELVTRAFSQQAIDELGMVGLKDRFSQID